MKEYIFGIDIGGTKCAVILGRGVLNQGEEEYEVLERLCFETEASRGPAPAIEKMLQRIQELLEKHQLKEEQILGIGISCGGPLDHVAGIIKNPPNLYGWDNVPIVDILEKKFHIPTYIQNDANACALAEWKFGAARGYQNVVFLTFGTGLGAGLILNGQLYTGMDDMAGEVGHVRLTEDGPVGFGKAGAFEGYCSGGGIAQIARTKVLEKLQMGETPAICPDLSRLDKLSAKTVALAAREGDSLSLDIYRTCGHYLGLGLSILIDILNPQIIVLGSVYERSGDLMYDAMMEVVEKETLEISRRGCKIEAAKLGNQIGDYAALSVALQGGSHEQ
ncbi:MAG: ROK family protein [Clostridiales bacterium]|nr:ROK family protein [Clostridiales bacterium]